MRVISCSWVWSIANAENSQINLRITNCPLRKSWASWVGDRKPMLLAKKYGIRSASDWQCRKKLASLNDLVNKFQWQRHKPEMKLGTQQFAMLTPSFETRHLYGLFICLFRVVCVGCCQKLVHIACCYPVHLLCPSDDQSCQKRIYCPRRCLPAPTRALIQLLSWSRVLMDFNKQVSENYDELVLTVDFRPLLQDLHCYYIYLLISSNDCHLTRVQQWHYLLDLIHHMLLALILQKRQKWGNADLKIAFLSSGKHGGLTKSNPLAHLSR